MKKFFKGLAASLLAGATLFTVVGCAEERPNGWEFDSSQHWHLDSEGEMVDQSAHNYTKWFVTKEATYDADGSHYKTCPDCGFIYTETIPRKVRTFTTVGYKDKELTFGENVTYLELKADQAFTIKSVDDKEFDKTNITLAEGFTLATTTDNKIKVAKDGFYQFNVTYEGDERNIKIELGEFNPIQYYVRGNLSGWGCQDKYKLSIDVATMTETIEVELAVGNEFKLSDNTSDWAHQFGGSGSHAKAEFDEKCFTDGDNLKCIKAGTYKITVSKINTDKPECKIELKK